MFIDTIKTLLSDKLSVGAIGGVTDSAYYIVGFIERRFMY